MITIPQIRAINLTYLQLNYYERLSDTLQSAINNLNSQVKDKNLLLLNYDGRLNNCQKIVDNNKKIVSDYQDVIKASSRKLWLLKLERNVLVVAVIAGAIDIFLVHK